MSNFSVTTLKTIHFFLRKKKKKNEEEEYKAMIWITVCVCFEDEQTSVTTHTKLVICVKAQHNTRKMPLEKLFKASSGCVKLKFDIPVEYELPSSSLCDNRI